MLSTTVAREWLDRWDRQQERYLTDREERFDVIADVVAAVVDRDDVVVLDLGCGPGSLSVRLATRLPAAQIVGVDADPLLLGLGRSAYADVPRLRFVQADLRADDWVEQAGLAEGVDAAVSTTALHWLDRAELTRVYARVGRLVRPGGVFVNGDHMHDPSATMDRVQTAVREARTSRLDAPGEDWQQWWAAAGDAAELTELIGARGARPIEHGVDDLPDYADHLRLLRSAGFHDVGTAWQYGDDRVVVGVRN